MGRGRATSKPLLDLLLLEEAGSHLGSILCIVRAYAYKHPQFYSSSRTRCLSTFCIRPHTLLCLQLLLACVSKQQGLASYCVQTSFDLCILLPLPEWVSRCKLQHWLPIPLNVVLLQLCFPCSDSPPPRPPQLAQVLLEGKRPC